MGRFVAGKLARLVLVMLAVSFLTFMMLELLPGDQATAIAASQNPLSLSPQTVENIRDELRLEDPVFVRYARWLGDVVRGDLGTSYETGQPVAEIIAESIPVTAEIGVLSIGLALLGAVPIGVMLAFRADTKLDRAATAVTFGLLAVPEFLLAIFLVYTFAVRFPIFPTFGWTPIGEGLVPHLRSLALPVTALTLGQLAIYSRLLRSDVIATLQEDYILAARAKGLPKARVLFRHALRPSLATLVTIAALELGAVIGGAALVETVFALPGVGRLLVVAVRERDVFLIQGLVLILAGAFVVVNVVVDILYGVLDPRVRGGRARDGI